MLPLLRKNIIRTLMFFVPRQLYETKTIAKGRREKRLLGKKNHLPLRGQSGLVGKGENNRSIGRGVQPGRRLSSLGFKAPRPLLSAPPSGAASNHYLGSVRTEHSFVLPALELFCIISYNCLNVNIECFAVGARLIRAVKRFVGQVILNNQQFLNCIRKKRYRLLWNLTIC